jgi:hypothetical protein
MGHNMRKFLLTCVVTLYQAIWTLTLGEETTMVKDVCRAWETMVMQISIGDSVIELIYHRC